MKVAYFDCFSGAAGDMIVGSLIDAGAAVPELRKGLTSLGLDGYALFIDSVKEHGLAATRFRVDLSEPNDQPYRHLSDITRLLERAPLGESVRKNVHRIFARLAEAEAKVHGTSVDEVHFHEVGAVDAMLDVVGAVLALELLQIDRVLCSPLITGSGTVQCAHGVLPVPAPATVELLDGVPFSSSDEAGELLTPTGAAVLTTLADGFGPMPTMTLESVGYGAGAREGASRPNLLRVLIGRIDDNGDADEITVLETNLDDVSPEVVGRCVDRLLEEGALDVYTVPIHMKKSRTGVLLTVLCEHTLRGRMERILFAETTTFGIRRHSASRVRLRRRFETVSTPFGDVRIKVGERDGVVTASPEYEDCKALADRHGVALRDIMSAASAAWAAGRSD